MSVKLIKLFAVVAGAQLIVAIVIFCLTPGQPVHAVMGMGIGLYLFWILPAVSS